MSDRWTKAREGDRARGASDPAAANAAGPPVPPGETSPPAGTARARERREAEASGAPRNRWEEARRRPARTEQLPPPPRDPVPPARDGRDRGPRADRPTVGGGGQPDRRPTVDVRANDRGPILGDEIPAGWGRDAAERGSARPAAGFDETVSRPRLDQSATRPDRTGRAERLVPAASTWPVRDPVGDPGSLRREPARTVVPPPEEAWEEDEPIRRDRPSPRTVTLGAILFVGIVAVIVGAGGVFGSDDPDPPPPTATVVATVIGAVGDATEAAGLAGSPVVDGPGVANPVNTGSPRWAGENDGRRIVCLDPGHGGTDTGYIRLEAAGLPLMAEADYVLAQAWDLADRLEEEGFEVVLTRRTPNAVNAAGEDVNGDGETVVDSPRAGEIDELQARIDMCNDAQADLLVSIHINGFQERPWVGGYETWYTGSRPFGDQNERFATLAFRALGEEMAAAGYVAAVRDINNDDTVDVDATDPNLLDNMIMTGGEQDGVTRPSEMPGAIVESLFITHDPDARFLATPEGQDAIVAAYQAAIVQYFAEYPDGPA